MDKYFPSGILFYIIGTIVAEVIIVQPPTRSTAVPEGTTFMIQCENNRGYEVTWNFNGFRITTRQGLEINSILDARTGTLKSYLTIMRATSSDSGIYKCASTEDPFLHADDVELFVQTRSSPVVITEPDTDAINVNSLKSFTIKCRKPPGVQLEWLFNDTVLFQSPKVIITSSQDVSILTRRSGRSSRQGIYTCRNTDNYSQQDHINVIELAVVEGKVPVEIFDPEESVVKYQLGSTISIMCKADLATDIIWYLDDEEIVAAEDGYFREDVLPPGEGVKTSLLVRENVDEHAGGMYTCENAIDENDFSQFKAVVDIGEDNETPTAAQKYTVVEMRVGSSVSLECDIKADGAHTAQWTKDDVAINPSSFHIIQSDSESSALTITQTNIDDQGLYECILTSRETGYVQAIVAFQLLTLPCPRLVKPKHGSIDKCPPREERVYGVACTFKCKDGRYLSSPEAVICDRNEFGETYWNKPIPECEEASSEDLKSQIYKSVSQVVLRVGEPLMLQCQERSSWLRDSLPIVVDGDVVDGTAKYEIRNGTLIIKNTDKTYEGIYDCNIENHVYGEVIRGVKSFNVTTLRCPPLQPLDNGKIERCARKAAHYGERCFYECDEGFVITGSRTRICELSHEKSETYWTGTEPTCNEKGEPKSWGGIGEQNSNNNNNSSSSNVYAHCLPIFFLVVFLNILYT